MEKNSHARGLPTDEIIAQLDVRAELEAAGVRFAGQPNAEGWLPCHAIDREDQTPSASVNIVSGYYNDFGSGAKLSLWDLLVAMRRFPDWRTARDHYAAKLGATNGKHDQNGHHGTNGTNGTPRPKQPLGHNLSFGGPGGFSWANQAFETICKRKIGVTRAQLERYGARPAIWRSRLPWTIAIPGRTNGDVTLEKPNAIVLLPVQGATFPACGKIAERKIHTCGGSKESWIAPADWKEVDGATEIWKCEGPTDAIALANILPAGSIAITNTGGCSANPSKLDVACLAHAQRICVIGDADEPGQDGAQRFALHVATETKAEVRLVKLPYPIEPNHGKDVRDWLAEGHSYEDLLALPCERIEPKATKSKADSKTRAGEKAKEKVSPISNADVEIVEVEENGKAKKEKRTTPRPMLRILDSIDDAVDGWPRRVGPRLFAHEPSADHVDFLSAADSLFGWLAARTGTINWYTALGCCSKREVFAELSRTTKRYESIEPIPHEPPIAGCYYLAPTPEPGDGTHLRDLLSRFAPATEIDRDLILAMLATPLWGGLPGSRPMFAITSDDGQGSGKSKLAELVADVYGGPISASTNDDFGDLKTRLLSPDALTCRIVVIDNVKSRELSSGDLESLITAGTISGRALYLGEGSRPNHLTWIMTSNGLSLATDLAQRSAIIKLSKPAYQPNWFEETRAFIRANHQAIIADLIAYLRQPAEPLDIVTRWGSWEQAIVSRLPEPAEAQILLRERQTSANAEQDRWSLIIEGFGERVRGLNYGDTDKVFLPSTVVAKWLNEILGEKSSTVQCGRMLAQAISAGRLPGIILVRTNSTRGFAWVGAEWVQEGMRMDIESRIDHYTRDRWRG